MRQQYLWDAIKSYTVLLHCIAQNVPKQLVSRIVKIRRNFRILKTINRTLWSELDNPHWTSVRLVLPVTGIRCPLNLQCTIATETAACGIFHQAEFIVFPRKSWKSWAWRIQRIYINKYSHYRVMHTRMYTHWLFIPKHLDIPLSWFYTRSYTIALTSLVAENICPVAFRRSIHCIWSKHFSHAPIVTPSYHPLYYHQKLMMISSHVGAQCGDKSD